MKSPIQAVCGDPGCPNNANGREVLCCSACGRCAEHSHQDCEETETAHGRPDCDERSTIALMAGTFFHGENLEVLRAWSPDDCVDMVYLDPPFNSDRDFAMPFGVAEARKAP